MLLSGLDEHMVRTLREQPGLTARELAGEIRSLRRASTPITRADVNRLLYGDHRFESDGGFVPRWSLAGQRVERVERRATTQRVRAEERRLDDAAERSLDRSIRAPAPVSSMHPTAPQVAWAGAWHIQGLRTWQQRALRAWFDADGRGIIEAVTGTGKTYLGLEAASRIAALGGATTILVPTVELQRQWARNVAEHTPHLSMATLGGDARGSCATADVTIALVQTAMNRDFPKLNRPRLVVADEAHRYGAVSWSQALRESYTHRLGLTATLERDGDSGVEDHLRPFFGPTVFSYDYRHAVPENVVAPFTLTLLGVDLSADESAEYDGWTRRLNKARFMLEQAGVMRGDAAEVNRRIAALTTMPGTLGQAARDFQNATRARRHLLARCREKVSAVGRLAPIVGASRGTVVFSQTIDTAEDAAKELRKHAVSASAIHSQLDREERRAHLDALRDESIAALCAPKILDEGIDIPNVDLGIVMSASSSRRQMIQRLGRIIRIKPDRSHARLVVLYARGTVEDPESGAHEAFLTMVAEVAARQTTLSKEWTLAQVEKAMDLPGTGNESQPARPAHGSQTRERARPDEAVPAESYYSDEALDWVRSVALSAMADAFVVRGRISPQDNVTSLIKAKLIEQATDWAVAEDPAPRAYLSARPFCLGAGTTSRRPLVAIERLDARPIIVQVDGESQGDSAHGLQEAARRGALAVWVRWGRGPARRVTGVAVIDLTDLSRSGAAEESPSASIALEGA